MHDALLDLLLDLDGVPQDPRYHPEGDALFHSLQVFGLARRQTRDPELIAAALLHDVGKAVSGPDHDAVGAELLQGLVSPRICWLVAHHLDLLRDPRATRARLRGDPRLDDLERLRAWDLGGRRPEALVFTLAEALSLLPHGALAPSPAKAVYPHAKELY
ncbi:MAG: HD domain-containing protein [Alphaproteobacteria bacterium]|nr:HD domain-containing protein [Alphaproteobacteria bacterium]